MTVKQLIGVLQACAAGDKVRVRIDGVTKDATSVTYDAYDVLTIVAK